MSYVSGFQDFVMLPQSAGVSAAALTIDRESRQSYLAVKARDSTLQGTFVELQAITSEYGLLKTYAGIRTCRRAWAFLASLPHGTSAPDVSVDPDGEVAFDWTDGGHLLSVSIGVGSDVAFAEFQDGCATPGSAFFDSGPLPESLATAIKGFRIQG